MRSEVELEDICWLIAVVLWEMARAALRDMLLRKDAANIETTRRLSES